MSDAIESVIPGSISNYTCTIENINGEKYNVTSNVVAVSIFESLFENFIHAEVMMLDVSALTDTIPIVGKEKFTISFTKDEIDYEIDFYINGITDRNEISESGTTYSLYLSTREEMFNSFNTYSKAYSGTNNEIIQKIMKDSLDSSVDLFENSDSVINYIVPMKKPVQAIKDLLLTSHDEYGSPFFLYQTLNGNGRINLRSLVSLVSSPFITKMDYGSSSTTTGESQREVTKNLYRLNELRFIKGFDTYNNISSGAYASTINSIDLNSKYYEKKTFEASKRAKVTINGVNNINNDSYDIIDSDLMFNEMYKSKITNYFMNKNQNNNIYGTNPFAKASINSYMSRMDTQLATGFGNSISSIEAGSRVFLQFPKSMMLISDDEEFYNDEIISGVYLVTSIRHFIKNDVYSMSYEFMREGITTEQSGLVSVEQSKRGSSIPLTKKL